MNRYIPLTLTLGLLAAASVANATGTLTIESAQGNGQWITTIKPGQTSGPPTRPTYTATVNWIDASGQTYVSVDSMRSYPLYAYAYASWTLELGAFGIVGLPTVTSP